MTQFSRFFKKLAGGWGKIGIIIPIFAVFLMSQNASAVERVSNPSVVIDNTTVVQNTTTTFNSWRLNNLIFNLQDGQYYSDYDRATIDFALAFSTTSTSTLSGCSLLRPFATVYRIIDQRIKTSDLDGWHICSYSVDVDISEVVGDLTRFYFYQNLFVTQDFSSTISSPSVNIYVRMIGPYSISYWNSEAKGVIGAITGELQGTESAINQQTQLQIQADNNISNQSSSSFGDISSPITTNLVGVLSSFVSSLSSITPAQTCQLNLPFPAFAGGSWQVNPCQLPSEMVTWINVFASVIAIFFYIPLIILLLKMIIGEIRSFQN